MGVDRARPVRPRRRLQLVDAATAEAEDRTGLRRELTLLQRVRRWLAVWRHRGVGEAGPCPYCARPPDRDCRRSCPTRKCGACGGLGVVIDLDRRLGVDFETGNPVHGGKLCGCQQ